ncbi:Enoyl-(Acyl carrier protein) reductase [Rhizoctonia solani]|uniref:Enoyl-(Acyl carrier protein) reductase n=3 Tax=Rhizoctonia solani TaxID=456999 RepID=A0A8H7H766_9AGAM|nr:Enoyl-(Acyl carrier protein) reductase [Rhizoctonia solani]
MERLNRNNLYDVKGRVALVTGGGTGIGLMITQTLVENGAKVYIASRRGEKVQQTARETPGHIVPLELDVTDKDSIRKAVKTIEEKEGKLDILVNKQALHRPSSTIPLHLKTRAPQHWEPHYLKMKKWRAHWQGLYGNNVASMFFVTYAFLGLLVKASEQRGPWTACVINISSVSGQLRISQAKWAYNSSKAGIIHLTKMFAKEFGLRKIPVRVNSIAPGTFPSEMTGHQDEHTLGKEDVDKASQGVQPIPFERSGNDIDMGGLALFLSSPAAYYVHGQIISIDGGFGAVNPTHPRIEMLVKYIMDHLLRDKLYDVSGRVALVTGGGTGIGLMITKTLAANGAKVYIGSRRGEKVEATAKETSPQVAGQIIPIELDVTNKTSIKNAVKTISENDGKLDLLVNNAAITGPVSMFFNDPSASENKSAEALGNALFENEKVEDWMGLYGNNVASIFFVTTAFLGLLSKASETRGAWSAGVINISSMSGQLRISENKFAYNSAKAANIQLTKIFATELALKKIPVRINAIAPGVYPSEMTGEQGTHTLPGKEASKIAQGLRPIPFDRSGNDADMGGLALFLASPAGYYVHGQVITTDGGFTAVHPAVS